MTVGTGSDAKQSSIEIFCLLDTAPMVKSPVCLRLASPELGRKIIPGEFLREGQFSGSGERFADGGDDKVGLEKWHAVAAVFGDDMLGVGNFREPFVVEFEPHGMEHCEISSVLFCEEGWQDARAHRRDKSDGYARRQMALAGFIERRVDFLQFFAGKVRIAQMMVVEPVDEFLLGWIDKDQADDVVRIHPGEDANEWAAEGMTDHDIGRRYPGVLQSGVKFDGDLTGVAGFGTKRGESSSGAIITDRPREFADRVLDSFPVFKRSAAAASSTAFKDDGWASSSCDEHANAMASGIHVAERVMSGIDSQCDRYRTTKDGK